MDREPSSRRFAIAQRVEPLSLSCPRVFILVLGEFLMKPHRRELSSFDQLILGPNRLWLLSRRSRFGSEMNPKETTIERR